MGKTQSFASLMTWRKHHHRSNKLQSLNDDNDVVPPQKKEEKLSKVATALLHVLKHKNENYDIVIAQVAPSVR